MTRAETEERGMELDKNRAYAHKNNPTQWYAWRPERGAPGSWHVNGNPEEPYVDHIPMLRYHFLDDLIELPALPNKEYEFCGPDEAEAICASGFWVQVYDRRACKQYAKDGVLFCRKKPKVAPACEFKARIYGFRMEPSKVIIEIAIPVCDAPSSLMDWVEDGKLAEVIIHE